MFIVTLLIGLLLLLLCFNSIRATVFITVLIGMLQDPIRKLVVGEPIYFTLLVGLFFGIGIIGALVRKGTHYFSPVAGVGGSLIYPLLLFLFVLLVQTFVTIIRYQEPALAAIGLIGYLAPLLAFPLTYYFVNNIEDVKTLLKLYISLSIILTIGVYLSFLGFDWKILKQVGEGLVIYDLGTIITAHSGFARSPDIAAWHIAAGICMLGLVSVITGNRLNRIVIIVIMVAMISAILLTGRRKMFMEVFLYLSFYLALLVFFKTSKNRMFIGLSILMLGVVVWLGIEIFFPENYGHQADLYTQRGASVFEDAPKRLSNLGLGSIYSAIYRVGLLGAGTGTASQGTRYFSDLSIAGGASEGGFGKILIELGVPGLLIIMWLLWRVANNIYLIFTYCNAYDSKTTHICIAISAFLGVNIPTFIVASQVYGDLYVLLVLGMFAGVIFATPKIVHTTGQQAVVSDDNVPETSFTYRES